MYYNYNDNYAKKKEHKIRKGKTVLKENKKENLPKINKEKLGVRFVNAIKKRWLISGTNTILLIAICIAVVILINTFVKSLNITPIDCTSNKQYTLTEESKTRISNINDNVKIYIIGYEENDGVSTLLKQYNKSNNNIDVEMIDINERIDIAAKYRITDESQSIIVENGDKSKVLYSDDLYTYDSSYNTIDLTEEKITSAILNVTSDKIPNIYFLTGYSDYKLEQSGGMYYLSQYLNDEVLNYNTLDMLVSGSIPDDCNTLVITTPSKDFDELTTNEIINYINKGGNILWLNSAYGQSIELTNVNKILALYGINPFDVGYIYETDNNRIPLGISSCVLESIVNTDIGKNLENAAFLTSTKINYNADGLSELGVVEQDIVTSASTSYFRANVSNSSTSTDGDVQGSFTIGGLFEKTISSTEDSDEIVSKLVIYADNNFISDLQLSSQVYPMIFMYNNKDLALNSIAYLTDQKEDITIRKDYTKAGNFTVTEGQKVLIMRIVFGVPIAIIFFGIIVWQIRRRKK